MPTEIIVPRLGWSMEEGIFAGWLKRDGDALTAGEPLFALESDKVTMEVESLDSGILQIPPDAPEPGGTVTVGQRIGFLLARNEPRNEAPEAGGAPSPTPPVEVRWPVSPRARAAARNLGVDVSKLAPAPGSKRVVEADVRHAAPMAAAPKASDRARKAIAALLEESFRTPHFYVHAEVDASFLARIREEMLPIVDERYHVRLTYNDLLVKAIAMTLRTTPHLNCYWKDGEIVSRSEVNIGLAAQTNDSLLVPVIRNADRLSVGQIALARHELVEKCRRSEAKLTDFEDGSVTLSNLGPFGVDRFQAILNPPQSAIVAVGRIARRPFVDGYDVVARLTMPMSISVDHRVVDGVAAAGFLNGIVQLLQSPLRLVIPAD